MANDVAMFNPKAMPAHIQAFVETNGNIAEPQTVPSLTYGGKIWSIVLDGKATPMMKINDDGDQEAVQVVKMVILDYAKRRGRAYYKGAFDANKTSSPLCWSEDGDKPDDHSKEKQSPTCAACPQSKKGSKVDTNGKETVACSQHRMIALVPAKKWSFPVLRLKLSITGDYDANSPDQEAQGWYAFSAYTKFLRQNNCSHTGVVVTKMKFDPSENYPKVMFAADRWLTEEELATVAAICEKPEVAALIGGVFTPEGGDGVRKDEAATSAKPEADPAVDAKAVAAKAAEEAKAAAKAARVAAAKKAMEEAEADDDGVIMSGEANAAAAAAKPVAATVTVDPVAAAKAAAKAAKAASQVAPGKAAAKAETAPAAAPTTVVPDNVKSLLTDWEA